MTDDLKKTMQHRNYNSDESNYQTNSNLRINNWWYVEPQVQSGGANCRVGDLFICITQEIKATLRVMRDFLPVLDSNAQVSWFYK